jgi:hypothetical protein
MYKNKTKPFKYKVYGTITQVHVIKDNKDKLVDKSMEGILTSIDETCMCYIPTLKNIFPSKDIVTK